MLPEPFMLTPLDNTLPNYYVSRLLMFPVASEHSDRAVQSLLRGLKTLFDAIPVLAGSIQAAHDDVQAGTLCVTCPYRSANDVFSVKKLQKSYNYQNLRNRGFPPSAFKLWDFVDMYFCNASKPPVMHAQVALIEGGLVLAPNFIHTFTDDTGFQSIVRLWASYCRGEVVHPDTFSSLFQRSPILLGNDFREEQSKQSLSGLHLHKLGQESHPTKVHLFKSRKSSWHSLLLRSRLLRSLSSRLSSAFERLTVGLNLSYFKAICRYYSRTLTTRLIYFPPEALANLKDVSNKALVATDTPEASSPSWVSTLDALSALLLSCVTQARLTARSKRPDHLPAPASTKAQLLTVVNMRKHLPPPHNNNSSLGNICLGSALTSSLDALVPPSIPVIASQAHLLRTRIQEVDREYLGRVCAALRAEPDISKVQLAFEHKDEFGLSLTSWSKHDPCTLDWGEGVGVRAEKSRLFEVLYDGMVIVFPEVVQEGGRGLEIMLCLRKDAMEQLEKDELFGGWARWKDCCACPRCRRACSNHGD